MLFGVKEWGNELEMLRRWPWGSLGVSAQYLSEGCHPGAPLIMIFSFLTLPHRETAEAMAYSLSLSLLYLGLLCGNGLVSARGSKLFTPGTALTTTSKTGVISLYHSSLICKQLGQSIQGRMVFTKNEFMHSVYTIFNCLLM